MLQHQKTRAYPTASRFVTQVSNLSQTRQETVRELVLADEPVVKNLQARRGIISGQVGAKPRILMDAPVGPSPRTDRLAIPT